jgi:hypothetical protein
MPHLVVLYILTDVSEMLTTSDIMAFIALIMEALGISGASHQLLRDCMIQYPRGLSPHFHGVRVFENSAEGILRAKRN